MPISLPKTLQLVSYTLYIITTIPSSTTNGGTVINLVFNIYQSVGHYEDNFLPIIRKEGVINDTNAIVAISALLNVDYTAAISAVEQFLISSNAYFTEGEIVA